MKTARWIRIGFFVAISMVGIAIAPAPAQVAPGGFQIDPTVIRQGIMGRMQPQLGFTDEEWIVIEPKLWKLIGLTVDANASALGNFGRGGGGGAGGGGRGGAGGGLGNILAQIFNNGQPSAVATRRDAMQKAIDTLDTTPQQFRLLLSEYRTAVAKARDQLQLAQRDLQNVLTVRQEAVLLGLGLLD